MMEKSCFERHGGFQAFVTIGRLSIVKRYRIDDRFYDCIVALRMIIGRCCFRGFLFHTAMGIWRIGVFKEFSIKDDELFSGDRISKASLLIELVLGERYFCNDQLLGSLSLTMLDTVRALDIDDEDDKCFGIFQFSNVGYINVIFTTCLLFRDNDDKTTRRFGSMVTNFTVSTSEAIEYQASERVVQMTTFAAIGL